MADGEISGLDAERVSVFRSDLPLADKLDRAREELLDLSARNRLLNIPRSAKSAKTLEVVDEASREVFRMLVREGKAFTFLPGKTAPGGSVDGSDEIADLAQPEDDGVDGRGVFLRHLDTKLQTRLTPAGLQNAFSNSTTMHGRLRRSRASTSSSWRSARSSGSVPAARSATRPWS